MEHIMKKETYNMPHSVGKPTIAMHKNSQTISKATKPKIRIIHIFAPEIIKTDVANFRELVQRLTGKPNSDHRRRAKKPRIREEPRKNEKNKAELSSTTRFLGLETREQYQRVKEEDIWNSNSSGGTGFLNGFADFDGFIQELGEFPLFPMDSTFSSHSHACS